MLNGTRHSYGQSENRHAKNQAGTLSSASQGLAGRCRLKHRTPIKTMAPTGGGHDCAFGITDLSGGVALLGADLNRIHWRFLSGICI